MKAVAFRGIFGFGVLLVLLVAVSVTGCETKKAQEAPKKATTAETATAESSEHPAKGDKPGEGEAEAKADHPPAAPAVSRAVAVLQPTEGNNVSGTVTFEKTDEGVKISGSLKGLTPGGHGFHVHQWGDCTAGDGKSAGGHFNPGGMPHAGPDAEQRHVGDLGNLTANDAGEATYERVDAHLSFSGAMSVLGRGLIVHAKADDLASQPTGAAGARVACAVIGASAPAE